MRKFSGVLTPRINGIAALAPQPLPTPPEVKLSMGVRGACQANLVVKVGDTVKVGQLIGEATEPSAAPVHASVSGTIKAIETIDTLTGERSSAVTITSDGNQTLWEGIAPPQRISTAKDFLDLIKNSGIVEPCAGGAGAEEFSLENCHKLEYILINCLESEPYVASDARVLADETENLWEGAKLLKFYLSPRKLILCIGKNNSRAVKAMRELAKGSVGIEIRPISHKYPQGQKNVLVRNVTGRVVPEGGSFADIGTLVLSGTTAAAIATYIKTGKPMVTRCVTVDGCAVTEPKNVIAPIGTPISALFELCGGLKDNVKKIILGGAISGLAVPNADVPIDKTTGAVLAFCSEDAKNSSPSSCIKCTRCIKMCPIRLIPPYIETAFELGKVENLRKYRADLCIECGCCAYVCPSKRPLSQVLALSKSILKKEEAK